MKNDVKFIFARITIALNALICNEIVGKTVLIERKEINSTGYSLLRIQSHITHNVTHSILEQKLLRSAQ